MAKKTYDNSMVNSFPDKFRMELPDGYRIDIDYDEDGEQTANLRGGFSFNDEGEETAEFSAAFITMNSTVENREELIKEGKLKERFVPGMMLEQVAEGVMTQLQEQFGPGTRLNLYSSYPASVIMKFYKPISFFGITIESYIVMYLVEVTENLFFGFNSVYQSSEEGNSAFYKHLLNVIKSVRVSSKAIDVGNLTPKKLEKALDMEPGDDVEALDLGGSIGISFKNGDEETHYTINSDGSITEDGAEVSGWDEPEDVDEEDDSEDLEDFIQDENGNINTLPIGNSYDIPFLLEHGKDIKRMIASGYGYVNYIALASCPNVEEFIVDRRSGFSFSDGVLYSKKGDKRTIEYVVRGVKHLHIDADVTDVSSYWHGVNEVTVDPKNNTFTVVGDMLLSRRKNILYFVTSKAEEVIIPEGVTKIHSRAFEYCKNLKKVVFPASYEWKGWHSSNTEPILITPDSMKNAEIIINGNKASYENEMVVTPSGNRIEPKLYLGDRKLCRIPARMTSTFGFDQAFAYVEKFEVSKDNPAFSSADGMILDKSGTKLLFYPKTRKNFSVPASVKEIERHSVSNCDGLTKIVIPGHVKKIGQMAFANCSCLEEVKTLDPDIEIAGDAYFGCHLLNGDSFTEPVDEAELKKTVIESIREIRKSNKRNDDSDGFLGGGLFGFGSALYGSSNNEVRISDDDNRRVIVDDKWSFDLPDGLELRFDSEHVDIMGDSTTAKYVVEGLEYNGRYFFDFELRERFDDGMSTDVDVIGCRHDSSVKSGNAQQKIIRDDDDLYVDLIQKPVFFFNSMASIRVRGDDLRSWDFTAGLKASDEEMSAKWDEVKALIKELAESIQLLDGAVKKKKKTKKKNEDTSADPDFIIQNGVLRKYIGDKRNVVIPDGVKEIADSTFSGFTKLKSVVVPEGVRKIGRRCFENCTNLKACYLPDSLEELGGYAFVDCHELKEVYLSDKIKSLGDSAFSECFALKDVRLPKKIKEIDAFTFKNCDEFTHIVIPEGVKSIGFSAFAACDNLEYLFIPESVKECQINLSAHPFAGSEKLTIYTPSGSYAQKFAEENGIPCENAAKGKVTADNKKASTKAAKELSEKNASGTGESGLAYATPDESLYPHYDSKQATQRIGLPGFNVVVNRHGTDYQFIHLTENLDDDADDALKEAVSKLSDTGAAAYKLADRASEMRKVFHVSPDIFDFRNDRECELVNDLMQKAYMMSALRSFAWTLSKLCDDLKKQPADLSIGQIKSIVEFISGREWLNYDGNSYCKALCGTSDIHVYYIPDSAPKSARSYFSETGSLDGLRKDLEYIYPAIEKLYEDIKENRDYNEPLESNDGVILYAWCALALAARGAFFTEDGPMMYLYSQEETEEERQQKEAERRRQAIEERAEISKKFLKTYGKHIEKNPRIDFRDKKFVFTGLSARRYAIGDDTDYAKLIEARGGLTRSGVSGVTDYLVVDPAGAGDSKISKAIENQQKGKPVKIILMDDFRKALGLPADESSTVEKSPETRNIAQADKAKATTAPAPKASSPDHKKSAQSKTSTERTAAGEKPVTVDNTWVVTVPAGFKYSTDKSIIGNHRNIIFMEDKADNRFEWPFDASISFTSAFNDSKDTPAAEMAKLMTGFMGSGNEVVLRDEEDIYVVYWYDNNRSEPGLQIFQINVGCGKGVSGIQVFFSDSKMSRREQTKLVEKVAKSIKLVGEAGSYEATPAAPSALTPEQQRQLDDINRQMDDLKEQAAFYSAHSHELSAEDRATLVETKREMEKLNSQLDGISTDQAKYGDYLRQKEEQERKKEEERQRKIAEAKAAGRQEDDEINMFVILCNEEKIKSSGEKTQKEFFDTYKDYFPAYKTRELGNLRKEVKEKIKDKETRRYYSESFMKRSVKDRYDVVTDSYFILDRYADYSLRSEDAIIRTAEWYTPEEMPEVRKLMDEQHDRDSKGANDAFDPVEKKWKKYWSAKEFLKIVVRDGDSGDLREDCRLFQTKVANNYFTGPVIVEVLLATKGMFQMSTPAMNFFPYYWDTTAKDIWETARRNEIKDNTTVYIDDINDIVRNAIRKIGEDYKDSYPDYKTTLNSWNTAINRNASGFAEYIAGLYNNTDRQFTAAEIKAKLKASFASIYDLAEAKEKLFQHAKRYGLTLLAEILSEHSAIKDIYDSIPKRLSDNIREVRKERIQKANEAAYSEAEKYCDSNDVKELEKAIVSLTSLGTFKDAKSLLKQASSKLEDIKSARYGEAVSLFNEGSEDAVIKAIEKLDELGEYKDAKTLTKEYREDLKKLKVYKSALESLEKNELNDLRNAKEKFETLAGFRDADEMLTSCDKKLEEIMSGMYDDALSLAEKQTEESFTAARAILIRLKPYRDSESRIEELNDLLAKEKLYKKAESAMQENELDSLREAKQHYSSIAGYKDSAEKSAECDNSIEMLCKYYYIKAREAEKTLTTGSQTEAKALYQRLQGWDDSADRIVQCNNRINTISQIDGLRDQVAAQKNKLAGLSGMFKGKERKALESSIADNERKIAELNDMLGLTNRSAADVVQEISVTTEVEPDPEIYVSVETEPAAPASNKPAKKSKKGLLIVIILMLLAIAAAVLYLTGVLYISPDAKECVVEEYVLESTPGRESVSIEQEMYSVDSEGDYYVMYKVTNTSEEDIWEFGGNAVFMDAKGKELSSEYIYYKGLLAPGKSVYLTAGTYDVKPEKIALIQLQGCSYSIGEVSYYVNPDTGKIEKAESDLVYNDSTDFEAANWLSFDIYNRGLDSDDWYEVDVTAQNSGPVSIKEIGYSIDYLDAEGNVLYGGTGSFEGDIASMGSKRSETSFCDAIDGAGMTKKVVSTVITGYSYSLSSDDSNGYNYYSVDLVNNIAFGYHFDD